MAIVFVLRAFKMDDSILAERRLFRLPIRIGRNPLADFQLEHGYVSDFHALVEDIAGRLCIRDLNSKNGVYVSFDGRFPTRVAQQSSVDLAPSGFHFFLGSHVRMSIEFEQTAAPQSARASSFSASVLGNQEILGTQPPPPPNLLSSARQPSVPPFGSSGFEPLPVASRHALEAPENALARTGILPLSLEQVALQGLRELAGSLAPGKSLNTTGDLARFITKLHDTIEVFCRCFIPLREGYAQFVSSLDLQKAAKQRSMMRSVSYLAAEGARDPAALAGALLDWQDRSMDAPKAVEEIFADLMIHQVALLDGMMQGVRGLLEQLAPENIERQVDIDPQTRFALDRTKARYKAIWETYSTMYEQLAEEKQAFAHIFGTQFTEAYREYRRQRQE
ncbi:MAG TPA: type VI secretion system-associated FHA domain protein [Polyangiaceae bacterium]|nr:type VI secretion system-associated FHA domain protein [Polyangiaceae bacterium]